MKATALCCLGGILVQDVAEQKEEQDFLSYGKAALLAQRISNESNAVTKKNHPLVKLNVGGRKYITTEDTLTSKGSNFFTALLDKIKHGSMKCLTDEDGFTFIDRNGNAFESVLEYLRTGLLFIPKGISREQVAAEFDFYSLDKDILETESHRLAHHPKWRTLAINFFQAYWSDIRDSLHEIVSEHGLHSCSLTLVHEISETKVQRFYNNIRVSLDKEFAAPLKPVFLDNIVYIFREYGFECSYENRQQTVDIALSWYQKNTKETTVSE